VYPTQVPLERVCSSKNRKFRVPICIINTQEDDTMSNRLLRFGSVMFLLTGSLCVAVNANGGPFRVRVPDNRPVVKGTLARLSEDNLLPARESHLRVLREQLVISFRQKGSFPWADVSAQYSIENPTDSAITLDIGFPIIREKENSWDTDWAPDQVLLDSVPQEVAIFYPPEIYKQIRQRAVQIIDSALKSDPKFSELAKGIQMPIFQSGSRQQLVKYLVDRGWSSRDATLLSNLYRLIRRKSATNEDPDKMGKNRRYYLFSNVYMEHLYESPLKAIGEEKITQLLSHVASCIDSQKVMNYERIFSAWGGDVRERSIDLKTGAVRPRVFNLIGKGLQNETIYTRINSLSDTTLSPEDRELLNSIINNLPVVFTFAPMTLLHTRVTFQSKKTQRLIFNYGQFLYEDNADPRSVQLAYVVHPASFWDTFGPINLEISIPPGVVLKASVPLKRKPGQESQKPEQYAGEVRDKTGELFIGLDHASWQKSLKLMSRQGK
jgi:hypothetical protein